MTPLEDIKRAIDDHLSDRSIPIDEMRENMEDLLDHIEIAIEAMDGQPVTNEE